MGLVVAETPSPWIVVSAGNYRSSRRENPDPPGLGKRLGMEGEKRLWRSNVLQFFPGSVIYVISTSGCLSKLHQRVLFLMSLVLAGERVWNLAQSLCPNPFPLKRFKEFVGLLGAHRRRWPPDDGGEDWSMPSLTSSGLMQRVFLQCVRRNDVQMLLLPSNLILFCN